MYLKQRLAVTASFVILLAWNGVITHLLLENYTRLNEITKGYTMCKVKKEKPTMRVLECLE